MIRRAENVPRGFRYPIRSEWGSSILNGLPRLVERGGNYADLFGIEHAGMGVYVNKTVHSRGRTAAPTPKKIDDAPSRLFASRR
jgi:hypothetical protein